VCPIGGQGKLRDVTSLMIMIMMMMMIIIIIIMIMTENFAQKNLNRIMCKQEKCKKILKLRVLEEWIRCHR
jgi:hypothetical protein